MVQVKDIDARAGIAEAVVLNAVTDEADVAADLVIDRGASCVPGTGLGLDFDLVPKRKNRRTGVGRRPLGVFKLIVRMVPKPHRHS
jgi:hypothetical protein